MRLTCICLTIIFCCAEWLTGGEPPKPEAGNNALPQRLEGEKDGVKVAWRVLKPENYDESHTWPLLVNLASLNTGHMDQDSWPLFATAGYLFIILEKFPQKTPLDTFHALVLDGVTQMKAKFKVDESRVFTQGFSVHGLYAMQEAVLHPKVFAGAISVCHLYASKIPTAQETGRPLWFMVLTGDKDYNHDPLAKSWQVYKQKGHEIEFKDVPGLPHLFRKSDVPMQIEWLDRAGPVKDFAARLAAAKTQEDKKQSRAATDAYRALANTKRAHPAVFEAEKRLAGLDQAAALPTGK